MIKNRPLLNKNEKNLLCMLKAWKKIIGYMCNYQVNKKRFLYVLLEEKYKSFSAIKTRLKLKVLSVRKCIK